MMELILGGEYLGWKLSLDLQPPDVFAQPWRNSGENKIKIISMPTGCSFLSHIEGLSYLPGNTDQTAGFKYAPIDLLV